MDGAELRLAKGLVSHERILYCRIHVHGCEVDFCEQGTTRYSWKPNGLRLGAKNGTPPRKS